MGCFWSKNQKMKVKILVLLILDSFRIVFVFKQLILTCLMDAQALHKCCHVQTEFLFHFHLALTLNRISFHFWENTLCFNWQWDKKGSACFPQKEAKKNAWVSFGSTFSAIALVQDAFLTLRKHQKRNECWSSNRWNVCKALTDNCLWGEIKIPEMKH